MAPAPVSEEIPDYKNRGNCGGRGSKNPCTTPVFLPDFQQ
jgi:hypothetical protein